MNDDDGRTDGGRGGTDAGREKRAHGAGAEHRGGAQQAGRSRPHHQTARRGHALLDGDAAAGLVAAEREELLDANAVGLAPDGEGARNVLLAVVDREALALEILKTGLVAFLDADGHTDGVAGVDFRELLRGELRGLLGVDLLDELDSHDCTYSFFAKSSSPAANVPPASRRSGRRRDVRSTAWRFRQA